MNAQDVVDKMETVWRSIDEFCTNLTTREWVLATDCPGWSVQDQLSHLAGSESRLLGNPVPDHKPANLSHVKNESGKRNEVVVDWRRALSGAEVLGEFRQLTNQRLEQLRAMSEDDFSAETQTPIGPGTVQSLIEIRIFDAWIHLQDMRRAVGRPGDMTGPVAEHAVGRCAMAMPFVVARKARAPEDTTVVFEITGEAGRVIPIGVAQKRARVLDVLPLTPTVRLTLDVETFACLACGRWSPRDTIESGRVRIEGDEKLAKTIVQEMNIMI